MTKIVIVSICFLMITSCGKNSVIKDNQVSNSAQNTEQKNKNI